MTKKAKLGAATIASFVAAFAATQASAETPFVPAQLGGSMEINSTVGSVGWSDNASLALATSVTPNSDRYAYWGHHWHASDNEARGSVVVSSGSDNTFSLGLNGGGDVISGLNDDSLDLVNASPTDLLDNALMVSYALTPAVEYTSTGTVTADLHTEGNASAKGLGETLGYVDVSVGNKTELVLSGYDTTPGADLTLVPLIGATSETTADLFGNMDSDGLISRVAYGAELIGTSGTELDITDKEVSQTITAGVNNAGSDFYFGRVVNGDLELEGDLDGNGMSMFQEADRTAIAGGGLSRKISFFTMAPTTTP